VRILGLTAAAAGADLAGGCFCCAIIAPGGASRNARNRMTTRFSVCIGLSDEIASDWKKQLTRFAEPV